MHGHQVFAGIDHTLHAHLCWLASRGKRAVAYQFRASGLVRLG